MGNTTKSNVKNKPRDLTIVKVGAAFVMMVLSMLAVQRVLEIYAVMNTFDAVYRASQICWKLCAVLCAASAVAYLLLRGKKFRGIFPYVFVLSALVGACALDLRYFWTEHATALYMAHAAVYCLYIIYCLYRSEFFCFSVAAIVSGFCFYFYSKGLGLNARTAVMAAGCGAGAGGGCAACKPCGKGQRPHLPVRQKACRLPGPLQPDGSVCRLHGAGVLPDCVPAARLGAVCLLLHVCGNCHRAYRRGVLHLPAQINRNDRFCYHLPVHKLDGKVIFCVRIIRCFQTRCC